MAGRRKFIKHSLLTTTLAFPAFINGKNLFASVFFEPGKKFFLIFDGYASETRDFCARVENRLYVFIRLDAAAEIESATVGRAEETAGALDRQRRRVSTALGLCRAAAARREGRRSGAFVAWLPMPTHLIYVLLFVISAAAVRASLRASSSEGRSTPSASGSAPSRWAW